MAIIQKYYNAWIKTLILTAFIFGIAACSNDSSNQDLQPNEAYWKVSSTVGSAQGSSAIIITGTPGVRWSAELTEGTSWCTFSYGNYTGAGTKMTGEIIGGDEINILYVYYPINSGKIQRQANLTFTFEGEEPQQFSLIQLAVDQQNLPFFGRWAELPSEKTSTNYQYVTHYALLGNQTVRNYSICYDKSKKAS